MPMTTLSPLHRLIPPDRRPAVDALLGARAVRSVEPLSGGASGAVMLRLELDGEACVLRADARPDGFRDPARQYACQAIAAAVGVAPGLLASDARGCVSLSVFVRPGVEPNRPEKLAQIARAVRRLHDSPGFPPLVPFLDGVGAILDGFIAARSAPARIGVQASSLLTRIKRAYPPAAGDLVSSHNDLNPGNILFGANGVVFVDWESAFAADRFVDLAAILNYFAADSVDDATLILAAYLGRLPTVRERARAEVMRQINRLFYGTILLMAAGQQGCLADDADFDGPGYDALRQGPIEAVTGKGKIALACAFLSDAFKAEREPAFDAALAAVAAP